MQIILIRNGFDFCVFTSSSVLFMIHEEFFVNVIGNSYICQCNCRMVTGSFF